MTLPTRRTTRLLLAFTAAATAVLTMAAPATAVAPVDPYQAYVDPGCLSFVEQPGVRVFRDMIMSRVGGTNGGIFACSGYEHGEGRAWDWMRNANDPAQAQQVQLVLDWLLATDAAGNRHAMARRLGIGNIIWNRRSISLWTTSAKVWNNYPCNGTPGSCHTNHVHFAFSWAGARQQTSWFTTANRPGDWYPGGLPATPRRAPDFSGDGVADLVGVTSGGHMQYYPNGSLINPNNVPFVGGGMSSGEGWNLYSRLIAADFSGDGVSDLVGVTPGGHMQFYPNGSLVNPNNIPFVGGGLSNGEGWNAYSRLIAADFSGDGVADLVGVTSGGHMQYYPNGSLINPNNIPFVGGGLSNGEGWNAYSRLIAADFSGDGVADLVGVTPGGHMQFYPNGSLVNPNNIPFVGGGLSNGEGWNLYSRLIAADFSSDGVADLVGVTPGGHMQYYPNGSLVNPNNIPFVGGGLSNGEGWNTYSELHASDFSGDGVADLVGVTPGGHMQFYPNGSLVNPNNIPFVGGGLSNGEGWNMYAMRLV